MDLCLMKSLTSICTLRSLERINQYLDIEHEPASTLTGKPPAAWPKSGELQIENLSARYSPVSDELHHIWGELKRESVVTRPVQISSMTYPSKSDQGNGLGSVSKSTINPWHPSFLTNFSRKNRKWQGKCQVDAQQTWTYFSNIRVPWHFHFYVVFLLKDLSSMTVFRRIPWTLTTFGRISRLSLRWLVFNLTKIPLIDDKILWI